MAYPYASVLVRPILVGKPHFKYRTRAVHCNGCRHFHRIGKDVQKVICECGEVLLVDRASCKN